MISENGSANLLKGKEIKQRSQQNQQKILEFLYAEKYSTSMIIKEVLGIKTRAGICKILRRMERDKLVKRHKLNNWVLLWGITSSGIHEAAETQDKITDWTYFEPSKVTLSTLDHQLDLQKVHAACIQNNLKFIPGRALGSRSQSDKIPDGIIIKDNKKIAVEIERHAKSRRRYDAIIYTYLKAIKAGKYNRILYISPTQKKANQIKKIFHSINKITMTVNGKNKPLKIIPEKHLVFFGFGSISLTKDYMEKMINN
jgi:hypothetical protein